MALQIAPHGLGGNSENFPKLALRLFTDIQPHRGRSPRLLRPEIGRSCLRHCPLRHRHYGVRLVRTNLGCLPFPLPQSASWTAEMHGVYCLLLREEDTDAPEHRVVPTTPCIPPAGASTPSLATEPINTSLAASMTDLLCRQVQSIDATRPATGARSIESLTLIFQLEVPKGVPSW